MVRFAVQRSMPSYTFAQEIIEKLKELCYAAAEKDAFNIVYTLSYDGIDKCIDHSLLYIKQYFIREGFRFSFMSTGQAYVLTISWDVIDEDI